MGLGSAPCSLLLLLLLLPAQLAHPGASVPSSSLQETGSPGEQEEDEEEGARMRAEALRALLQVLGLDAPPPTPALKRQPPQYMLDLYRTVATADGLTRSPHLLPGDTVRSFWDTPPSDELHFHFVLSAMAPSEQILSAQLHLFRLPGSPVPPTQRGSLCQVSVFQVLEEEEEELATVAGSESGARLRLLAVRLVPVHGTGWEVFPITEAVRAWTERAASNRGLLVTLQSPGGTALEPRPLRFASGHLHHHSKRPMLVLFTDNSRRAPPPIFPQFPASMFPGLIPGPNHTRLARSLSPFRPCQRLPLYVDFEEIGWMGWIISPHGYNAYQCRGSCPFPLGQNMQPTNHATVQSIISALRLVPAVSSPCCVPRQLASISLLYFDEAENVVLKHYEGMVARECGCH
ncbi:bone morphogenetic protein 2 isoform X1 [Ornithorhynchus anatinus]|uniref:bone morphogenetic protein 2 isoform X1 n=1 Tax=Ornithorhynchus anatinus TaxID=9258 RepID=UPI0010A7F95A|nr:bone morphogenetic protein 2 isoform X1 [Ornithorhynchus anatinus]